MREEKDVHLRKKGKGEKIVAGFGSRFDEKPLPQKETDKDSAFGLRKGRKAPCVRLKKRRGKRSLSTSGSQREDVPMW